MLIAPNGPNLGPDRRLNDHPQNSLGARPARGLQTQRIRSLERERDHQQKRQTAEHRPARCPRLDRFFTHLQTSSLHPASRTTLPNTHRPSNAASSGQMAPESDSPNSIRPSAPDPATQPTPGARHDPGKPRHTGLLILWALPMPRPIVQSLHVIKPRPLAAAGKVPPCLPSPLPSPLPIPLLHPTPRRRLKLLRPNPLRGRTPPDITQGKTT